MSVRQPAADLASPAAWLAAYGRAWEAKDSAAFTAVFTEDVRYHWTPFGEAKAGRGGVAEAFVEAVARQRGIRFAAEVLAEVAGGFLAHWSCGFERVATGLPVRLDGIFLVERRADGLCHTFREWWHSDEAP